MILEQETFEAFGYYPSDLTHGSKKLILTACELCGKFRILSKSNYKTFCRSCAGQYKARKKKRIECVCLVCGKRFEVLQYKIDHGCGKYCSRKCQYKGRSGTNSSWYGKTGLNCHNYKGGFSKCICLECGKEFYAPPSGIKRGQYVYCSRKCYGRAHKGDKNRRWKGGISFEPYCVKFNNAFKDYIRAKFGYRCFLCPTTQAENGNKLSVHHVNYNKDCGGDGDKTCNFVPLCRSCHTKTNTNRDYWQKIITDKLHCLIIGWDV